MPLLAATAWGTCLGLRLLAGWLVVLGLLALVVGTSVVVHRDRPALRMVAAAGVVALTAGLVSWAHLERARDNPAADLASVGAAVTAEAVVTGDPRTVHGPYGDQVLVHAQLTAVTGRGRSATLRAPVLLMTDDWPRTVDLGTRIRLAGRLLESDDPGLSALLRVSGRPRPVADPDVWWRAATAVRRSMVDSVVGGPSEEAAIVPALVTGDDSGVSEPLADDFRRTGLTHLLAVSGTNLTLVIGFLVVLGRWTGIRGRGLTLLGAVGIVGFVLLARAEPSVLRAAAMGSVALLATTVDAAARGIRALAVAVLCLLLVDPAMASSIGFALSVAATAGILLVAPRFRRALARWLPGWLADAIAIPLAAQLACGPLIAALSGQVSLISVLANLLVAPAIGPATVLGLLGGLAGLLWPPAGAALGWLACGCVAWVVAVAHGLSDFPGAVVGWGTGVWSILLLVVLTFVAIRAGPRLLRRPATAGLTCAALALPLGWQTVVDHTPVGSWLGRGWPPPGWVLVVCDVGQGDGLVLNAGGGAAVVVDTGPEPQAMGQCLDRLRVERVPLVVLTHFHADHVDGLPAVLDGRPVGEVDVTGDADPAYGASEVARETRAAGVAERVLAWGETRTVGQLRLQTLWPPPDLVADDPNDASIVLLVQVRGLRLLLSGDVEPSAQERLASTWPGLRADVLKVPHHGSGYQDVDWLRSLGARAALISVGVDNDYGHPAPQTLAALRADGMTVHRTDLSGDLAVSVVGGRWFVTPHH
jgi:competence protein ComEC